MRPTQPSPAWSPTAPPSGNHPPASPSGQHAPTLIAHHAVRLSVRGDVWTYQRDTTRSTVEFSDGNRIQTVRHERADDGKDLLRLHEGHPDQVEGEPPPASRSPINLFGEALARRPHPCRTAAIGTPAWRLRSRRVSRFAGIYPRPQPHLHLDPVCGPPPRSAAATGGLARLAREALPGVATVPAGTASLAPSAGTQPTPGRSVAGWSWPT